MKLFEIPISLAGLYAVARTIRRLGQNLLLRGSENALRFLWFYRHF
jgi:hypothetical protein